MSHPMLMAVLIATPITSTVAQTDQTFDSVVVLFGNLHSHSTLSGDVHTDSLMRPMDGWRIADSAGLDFLGISDHHKALDAPGSTLRLTDAEFQALRDSAAAYHNAHPKFVALAGIEYGNTATGNHMNVFGAVTLPSPTIVDTAYDQIYAWAVGQQAVVQFNHPNSWRGKSNRNKNVGNFGEDLYPDQASFVSNTDAAVSLVSIITTVRGGHLSGEHRHSTAKTHRDAQWEEYYQEFLNMGFHISPAANQDTHRHNWGTVTAARTAVWSDSRSAEDLLDAIRANRAYATEDDELAVVFQVEHDGQRHWMGESVSLGAAEDSVTLLVRIWQVAGDDPTDEGPYTVEILSDWDGVGGREVAVWETQPDLAAGVTHRFEVPVLAGEYLYLRVTEQGGRDNGIGQGDDLSNNATGADVPDGLRDDLNDQAWTSPIWFIE